ncbi:CUB and sushi domain-containing protein 3 [Liparis tanakae]|uniref:CUB and sushi domain-containing protein 3 n=1 Tax=Liparis tanakae TaxID=230148 RepID=A0A4Z2E6E4_9TELE|nr:CUB and sushi domain-containing protein 3 [Liparis tanakae]
MNGTIYSPGHPAEYPHFLDCVWTVLIKFHSDFSTSGFFVLQYYAYQLRTCQRPPPVANATFLSDDDEFEIGVSCLCFTDESEEPSPGLRSFTW